MSVNRKTFQVQDTLSTVSVWRHNHPKHGPAFLVKVRNIVQDDPRASFDSIHRGTWTAWICWRGQQWDDPLAAPYHDEKCLEWACARGLIAMAYDSWRCARTAA